MNAYFKKKKRHCETESIMVLQNHKTSRYIMKKFCSSPMASWLWSLHALSELICLWRVSSVSEMWKSYFNIFFHSKSYNMYLISRSRKNHRVTVFWKVSSLFNKHDIGEYQSHRTKLNDQVFLVVQLSTLEWSLQCSL